MCELRVGYQVDSAGVRLPCGLLSQRSFGGAGKGGKGAGVADRQLGEDLAVDLDAGLGQTFDEPAVGDAVAAGCRVDAGDPEAAERCPCLSLRSRYA